MDWSAKRRSRITRSSLSVYTCISVLLQQHTISTVNNTVSTYIYSRPGHVEKNFGDDNDYYNLCIPVNEEIQCWHIKSRWVSQYSDLPPSNLYIYIYISQWSLNNTAIVEGNKAGKGWVSLAAVLWIVGCGRRNGVNPPTMRPGKLLLSFFYEYNFIFNNNFLLFRFFFF